MSVTTKVSTRIIAAPGEYAVQGNGTIRYEVPEYGAGADIYLYSVMGEFKSNLLASIRVPPAARGRGIGSMLLHKIIEDHDSQGLALRLTVAGCCFPDARMPPEVTANLHASSGHLTLCSDKFSMMSYHQLQNWYRGNGFREYRSPGARCCGYHLFRPVGGGNA